MHFVVGRTNPSIMHKSPSKILQSHHLLLMREEDYWHFRLRPQGIIDIPCGEGSTQFVTTLPKKCQSGYSVGTARHSLASSYLAVLDSNEAQRGGASQQIGWA